MILISRVDLNILRRHNLTENSHILLFLFFIFINFLIIFFYINNAFSLLFFFYKLIYIIIIIIFIIPLPLIIVSLFLSHFLIISYSTCVKNRIIVHYLFNQNVWIGYYLVVTNTSQSTYLVSQSANIFR